MAAAAVRGSLENVAINLDSITDSAFVSRMKSQAQALLLRITEGSATAEKTLQAKLRELREIR